MTKKEIEGLAAVLQFIGDISWEGRLPGSPPRQSAEQAPPTSEEKGDE